MLENSSVTGAGGMGVVDEVRETMEVRSCRAFSQCKDLSFYFE